MILKTLLNKLRGGPGIPQHISEFITQVNSTNRIRTADPETSIGDVMGGYEKGKDTIIEFYRRLQCLGILTQEFDFNPSFGHLKASNWYFHVNDILPSIEALRSQGSAQIGGIVGAHVHDIFDYANQYGAQNDYGRLFLSVGQVSGRLSLEQKALIVDLSMGGVSSREFEYDRTNSTHLRKSVVKIAMADINARG